MTFFRRMLRTVLRPRLSISALLLTGIILIAAGQSLQAQSQPPKYSKVKIWISSPADAQALQQANLVLDHFHAAPDHIETVLNEYELAKLQQSGLGYEVLIPDLSAHYEANIRRTPAELKILEKEMQEQYNVSGFGFGSMGGYYTFDEVVAQLDSMRLNYPNLISQRESIGLSLQGRDLWAVRISDNPDLNEGEPEILYTALHHAREPQSMATIVYFMYYLLENYGTNPDVTYLVNNRELYFVPVLNPDGYVYNQQTNPNGGGYWRKNRRNNGNGTFGVDLNRNYGFQWGYDNSGSSPDPGDETYRGTAAFSEPETQVIRDFCNVHTFKLGLNYHSYQNILIYPWGYINALPPAPDDGIFIALAEDMTQFNNYDHGNSTQLLYPVNGSSDDWMYGEQTTKDKIFSMTPEVGSFFDGFWPDPNRIFPLAEENVYLNMALARGEGVITADSLDPLPPANPAAYSDYTTPTSIQINWIDPTSLANGDPLLPGEFTIEISRDGSPLASVNGGMQGYTDSGLNDGQEYNYDLYTRVTATDSTSEAVGVSWIAGGSPVPTAPAGLSCIPSTSQAMLSWSDPTTQIDGTPLDDLDHINIYRNGILIGSAAPGAESYTDTPPQGFTYDYYITAVDNENPPNVSAPGNTVNCFVGDTPNFMVWVGPDATGESAESGDSLFAALVANGESSFLSNDLFEFGTDLSIYDGIFVVLGIFSNNHVIEAGDPEGPALQAYLQNGGRLYLEGGDCFNYDPEVGGYNIRPWFALDDGPDGSGDLSGVTGQNDLSAFSFSYNGENNWMDELQPAGSTPVWKNSGNSDISGVFYSGFGNGSALGVVPSFGGLVDNSAPLNHQARPLAAAAVVRKPGDGRIKPRPERTVTAAPFVKKAAYYPELKKERKQRNELVYITPQGIEILAGTKTELMAAYLALLGYSGGPGNCLGIDPAFLGHSLPTGGSVSDTLTLSNTCPAPLNFSISLPVQGLEWLSVLPETGQIPANGSVSITVSFDAANIWPGNYGGEFFVLVEDSVNPSYPVPVTLEVTEPAWIDPSPLVFSDTVLVGEQSTLPLQLSNSTNLGITVSDIISTHGDFSAAPAQLTVPATGNATVQVTFSPSAPGNFNAMLKLVNDFAAGDTSYVAVEGVAKLASGITPPELPESFAVSANYPNPFNPSTTIAYQLPSSAEVRLAIYNVLGQRVRVLIDRMVPPGYYQAVWDGRDMNGRSVGSGVYIYEFQAGSYRQVRKMMLLK